MELHWSDKARAALLPRRRSDPESSRVHEPGLLAELDDRLEPARDFEWAKREEREWLEIRRLLASAMAETYAAARNFVRTRLEPPDGTGRPLWRRVLVAQAFTADPEFASELLDECLAASSCPPQAELLLGLVDSARTSKLIAALPEPPVSRVFELVESFGADAVPLLVEVHDRLLAGSKPKVSRLAPVLEAFAIVPCDESGRRLARHLDSSTLRRIGARFFRDAPEIALRVLPEACAGRSKAASVAKTLLEQAMSDEALVARVLPGLDATARSRIEKLRSTAGGAAEEAPPAAWPEVLRNPRWRGTKGRTLPVVKGLMAIEGELGLPPAQRDAWAARLPMISARRVLTPGAALPIAHARAKGQHREACDAWIRSFPELAAIGLVPPALREPSPVRTEAGRLLRRLAASDPDAVERALARYPEGVRTSAREVLELDPLEDCPVRAPKLPAFVNLDALPSPRLHDGRALPEAAKKALCEMIAFSDLDVPYEGHAQLREACTSDSLDAFACGLFDAWRGHGAPARSAWPIVGLAMLGRRGAARELAAWVRERSSGKGGSKKPGPTLELALRALGELGTDGALARLHAFAEGGATETLRGASRAAFEEVASRRGLDAEQLADRVVPDYGLSAAAPIELSYGLRRFTVRFDEQLAPRVRDAEGAWHSTLPKPRSSDDPAEVERARGRFSELREEGRAVLRGQARRLERAMVRGRRWSVEDFERYVVRHPLFGLLAERLLWASYDEEGRRSALFRVAEDRSLAGADDADFTLRAEDRVGLPHALDLGDAERGTWAERFAEYEIVPPFEQLGREVHRLEGEEAGENELGRVRERVIDVGRLFALEARGWVRAKGFLVQSYSRDLGDLGEERGAPDLGERGAERGVERAVGRGVERAGVRLVLEPGYERPSMASAPPQRIRLFLETRGARLGDLSPMTFSELVRELLRHTDPP